MDKTVFEHIRDHLLKGVPLIDYDKDVVTLDELKRTEWNREFEKHMRDRLIIGGLRYGRMGSGEKKQYDFTGATERCMQRYRETGNLEFLVDAANNCMLEFVESKHPKRHFRATDDEDHLY